MAVAIDRFSFSAIVQRECRMVFLLSVTEGGDLPPPPLEVEKRSDGFCIKFS